ncbi:PIN domain-containing protein [Pelagibius sp. CAU 1746]|uniref:PIN domain-containing protein n=1 Tax=Pelagibius sp. CAU 1746 TaxID=3140370 RepID=UPI00325BD1D8
MSYVFDTSAFSPLFRNFYRGRFPSLWREYDELVADGRIVSTREVHREIEDGPIESLRGWANENMNLFPPPTAAQGAFVGEIYRVPHFQQNIELQKILKGGKNADPFVIARAQVDERTVVTSEALRPNASKIPNICEHFGINWLTLEGFMEAEDWEF